MSTPPTFESVYEQFLDDLKGSFPEFETALLHASSVPDVQPRFLDVWKPHIHLVSETSATVFDGAGIELVPGFVMTRALWDSCSESTHTAIWKYIGTLLLLSAQSDTFQFNDISGFSDDLKRMMGLLGADISGGFAGLFESFSKFAETFGFPDISGFAAGAGAAGAAGASKFKIPERLFKGHIAKIAQELVAEFKPEDFGLTPDLLESKDPQAVFSFLQEIFSKKPEMLMTVAQKIATRIRTKFMRGEIKRDEIIREAEELMKEFSDNDMFSELFGSLKSAMTGSEKETGNEGSARRREAQERLRKKAAEKAAKRDATAATAAATAATTNTLVPTNTLVSDAAARADAAMTALLLEEDTKKPATKSRGRGR